VIVFLIDSDWSFVDFCAQRGKDASLGPRVVSSLHDLVSFDDPPGPQGDAFYGGFYSYVQKDLRDLLASTHRSGHRDRLAPRARYSRIYCASGTLRSCRSLLIRTLREAVADLSVESYRTEAERFFAGETFVDYCDILGWNVRRARASLGRFVDSGSRISGNHLLTAAELAAQRMAPVPAVAV